MIGLLMRFAPALGRTGRVALAAALFAAAFCSAERSAIAQERAGTLPTAVPEPERTAVDVPTEDMEPRPFGASLFLDGGRAGGGGPHPDYVITRGDEVAIFVWGAVDINAVAEVDPGGNIFLEDVGPIRVAGVRSGDLNAHIAKEVGNFFTENVETYATLVDARTIGVFVTGFVQRPGRYPGTPSESIIDFLAKAGGIDPERGSFRDIVVTRGNRAVARADLYAFLLDGRLPKVQFREGDTVLVREQRATVAVEGAVRNNFQFEFPPRKAMTGSELIRLARPMPDATHALLSGTRDSRPYASYQTLAELGKVTLRDQDRLVFDADARQDTLTVKILGSHLGSSVFVAAPDTTTQQLLDYIAVDPNMADVQAVHMRRRRVAVQQKQSLDDSLERLERTVLTSTAPTDGSARILQTEADLVMQYIDRARALQPQGVVVLADGGGRIADIRLEDGDEIVIPLRSQIVVIGGEVVAPQTVVFDGSQSAADYVSLAGGYTERAETDTFIVRRPNGRVVVGPNPEVGPGDEVVVPPRVGGKGWQIVKDLAQVVFQAVFAGAVILDRN